MNSKERVLTAINLAQPDRVPMDFSANAATLERLKCDLGTPTHKQLLKRLGVDIIDIRGVVDPEYCGPVPKETVLSDGTKQNYWGWRTKNMPTATGPEECFCDFALGQCRTVEELMAHNWPSVDWFNFSDFSERVEEWSEFAVLATGASIFQHTTFLRTLEQMLMDMLTAPELACYMMDRFTDFYVAYFDKMFSSAVGKIDVFRIADDIGMQDRLLIGPEQFEVFFAPRLKKLVDMAHSHEIKVMFHSCGSIVPLINRIIELEVDILDPIQVAAAQMDPEFLKDSFGDKICLHGSIDTQYILPKGSATDVTENVKKMIGILGKGGGFILAPCHVVQTDVPTENVVALYDTGYNFSD